jgi:hypothetical protein
MNRFGADFLRLAKLEVAEACDDDPKSELDIILAR